MTPRPGQLSRWYIWKYDYAGLWIVSPPVPANGRRPEFFDTFNDACTAFANGGKS